MLKLLRHHAFTIIEMLFVIAIIGVIASFGISLYEKQAESTKISKTVIEMQRILQAASYYYSQSIDTDTSHSDTYNKHIWPDQFKAGYVSSLDCNKQPASAAPQLCTYLSLPQNNKVLKNPWGEDYKWKAMYVKNLDPPTNTFYLQTTVPTANTAARIAAKLPDSSHTKNIVTVRIGPPSGQIFSTVTLGQEVFGGAGYAVMKNGALCAHYNCPPGTVFDHISTAINSFAVLNAKHSTLDTDLIDTIAILNPPPPPGSKAYCPAVGTCPPNSKEISTEIEITGRTKFTDPQIYCHKVGVMYVASCKRVK